MPPRLTALPRASAPTSRAIERVAELAARGDPIELDLAGLSSSGPNPALPVRLAERTHPLLGSVRVNTPGRRL